MASQMVDTVSLKPNRWNYNTQPPAVFQKVVESLRHYGFTEPVVVRTLPGGKGLEIINGEHRWRAAGLLGMPKVPVFNLGTIDDRTAKQLSITLNELGGTSDEIRLAQLMRDIVASPTNDLEATYSDEAIERVTRSMPFSETAVRHMVESVDFSFSHLGKKDVRPAPTKAEREAPPPEKAEPPLTKRPHLPITVRRSRLEAINPDVSAAVLWLLDWHDATRKETP